MGRSRAEFGTETGTHVTASLWMPRVRSSSKNSIMTSDGTIIKRPARTTTTHASAYQITMVRVTIVAWLPAIMRSPMRASMVSTSRAGVHRAV